MRVEIINRKGLAWKFDNIKKALANIKKGKRANYTVIDNVRVYDDRDEFDEQ